MRPILSALLCLAGACAVCASTGNALAAQEPAHQRRADSAEAVPLGKLPRWAVPRSYRLEFRVDPKQDGYSGTTTIKLDL